MKIQNEIKQMQAVNQVRPTTEGKATFDHLVQSQALKIEQQEIQRLVDKITEQGNKLARYRTFRELAKFKRYVKGFLQTTVYQGYELERNHHFSYDGQSRNLLIIKEVDEKLITLTEAIMDQEKNTVDLLGLIGEIKGLLIHLYI